MTTLTESDTFRQTAECTCCVPARPISRDIPVVDEQPDFENARIEWAHDDDEHLAVVAHIHVDTVARDCDGTWPHAHTYWPADFLDRAPVTAAARVDGTDLVEFWNRVATFTLPFWMHHDVTIKIRDGRAEWSETTDEGGAAGEMRLCHSPYCAEDDRG